MSPLTESLKVAVGEVVNVKSIPSRGVTRIEIEVPLEAHVGATELLFGKPALVMAIAGKAGDLAAGSHYGVMPFNRALDMTRQSPATPTVAAGAAGMFGGARRSIDYVGMAARACREGGGFWRVLENATGMPVASEAQAIVALRSTLGIESRSELATNNEACARLTSLMASASELGSVAA